MNASPLRVLKKKIGIGARHAGQLFFCLPVLVFLRLVSRRRIISVTRYSGIGDIISTLPAINTLKALNRKAIIVYETRSTYAPLLRLLSTIDVVVTKGSPLHLLCKALSMVDNAVRPTLPDESIPPLPRRKVPIAEEFLPSFDLLKLVDAETRVEVPGRARRRIREKLKVHGLSDKKPLIVVHTGPTWQVKEWPDRDWFIWSSRIQEHFGGALIQIGNDLSAYGQSRKSGRIPNAAHWIGCLSLTETLALLKEADLFVGVDSGPLHMAGLAGTPSVGLFGPTCSPLVPSKSVPMVALEAPVPCFACHYSNSGPIHWQTNCPYNIRCMRSISVSDVVEACAIALGTRLRTD